MALEDKIDALIVALDKHTAAITGKAPAVTAGKTVAATGGKATTTKTGPTFEQVKAALMKVKDEKGKPAAQKIIATEGGAKEMIAIDKSKYAAVLAAAQAALAPEEEVAAEEEAEAEDTL